MVKTRLLIFERLHFDISVVLIVLVLYFADPLMFLQKFILATLIVLNLEKAYGRAKRIHQRKL